MRRVEWMLATAGAFLGALHVALTVVFYRHVSLEALWFAGAGLGVVSVATMNIVALRAGDQSSPLILLAANTAMASFFTAAWLLMKAPQAALGVVLFAGLALCTLLRALRARKPALVS